MTKPVAAIRRTMRLNVGRNMAGTMVAVHLLAGAFLVVGSTLGSAEAFAQGSAPAKPEPAKPEPAKAEKIATELCAACHGPDGNSIAPTNPKIASQHPEYLRKQLKDFKDPEGDAPAARQSAIMTPLVANLSDEDMRNLAAYYSAKPYKPSAAREKELVELGREIYRGGIAEKGVPACSGCHGPTGSGIPARYPSLGGQFAEYTEAQLNAFRSGTRANNPEMATIAARLSDREIKAVSDYAAGLR